MGDDSRTDRLKDESSHGSVDPTPSTRNYSGNKAAHNWWKELVGKKSAAVLQRDEIKERWETLKHVPYHLGDCRTKDNSQDGALHVRFPSISA